MLKIPCFVELVPALQCGREAESAGVVEMVKLCFGCSFKLCLGQIIIHQQEAILAC
jgi:hypothetical protein